MAHSRTRSGTQVEPGVGCGTQIVPGLGVAQV
jgi:hypothetical protein